MDNQNKMAAINETKDHLNYILSQVAKQQNIENYETILNTDANLGDGFAGQFFLGDIRNKNTGEILNVGIKKAPLWEFEYQELFSNEFVFYEKSYPVLNDLQKEARVSIPFDSVSKYFCGDLETKKEYIAMENLKVQGYVMFDKTQLMDEQHLETIFKTYGKFHALSFVLKNKNLEKYASIIKDFADLSSLVVNFAGKPIVSAICAAVDGLDPQKDKTAYEELHDFGSHTIDILKQLLVYRGKYSCLVHGDCWSNNMLFKYAESGKLLKIKLVDFQLTEENTPIHDLSYFFYSSGSKKDFDKLNYYLEVYHQSFSEFAVELGGNPDELLPLEVLKKEWKEYGLYGIIMGIYLWQVKLTSKEEITEFLNENSQEKVSTEENSETMKKFLESANNSELFKSRTTDILRHAFEYGILSKSRILGNKE